MWTHVDHCIKQQHPPVGEREGGGVCGTLCCGHGPHLPTGPHTALSPQQELPISRKDNANRNHAGESTSILL